MGGGTIAINVLFFLIFLYGLPIIGASTTQNTEVCRNDFTVSLPLGDGGFSRVFAAMHNHSQQWLALKVTPIAALKKHKKGVEMILSELDILMSMGKHQYIVGLHFAFRDTSRCYFGTMCSESMTACRNL